MVRALVTSTYVPTFLAEIGVGAILAIFVTSALSMGSSSALSSVVVGAYALGRLPGSTLGGKLTVISGPAHATTWGMLVTAVGAVVCALSATFVPLAIGALVVGAGHAAFHVSRQAQVLSIVSRSFRARGLTTLAGIWRIGNFVGPLIGALFISAWGLRSTYVFAAVAIVSAIGALMVTSSWSERHHHVKGRVTSVRKVLRGSMPVFRTLGVAVLLTGAIRAARLSVIPMWAHAVGMSPEATSLVFALSGAVDMLFFYPAGAVMDRWGRKWTAVPSTVLLSLGILMLPFTTGATGVTIAAVVLGLGNGWGSGVLMTLGSDVAPPNGRAIFTGIWMIFQDVGGLAGPAAVSVGAALVSVPFGFFAVGSMGLVTAGALYYWIPPWRLQDDG